MKAFYGEHVHYTRRKLNTKEIKIMQHFNFVVVYLKIT